MKRWFVMTDFEIYQLEWHYDGPWDETGRHNYALGDGFRTKWEAQQAVRKAKPLLTNTYHKKK